jgi:hypothetical protein
VREKFLEILDRIGKYQSLHSSAENRLCEIPSKKGIELFHIHEGNPSNSFIIRLEVAKKKDVCCTVSAPSHFS